MAHKKTYNPCDDCKYSYSRNGQESGMCKICELEYFKDRLLEFRTADVVPKSEIEKIFEEIWDAFQSTYYDSEFEEKFDKIEKKYMEGIQNDIQG